MIVFFVGMGKVIFWSDDKKISYNKWVVLIGEKTIEDSIKDRLIITIGATKMFFDLKAANVKPPKASLDAMDILKLTCATCGGVLVNDYAVYKKWINEWIQQKFYEPYHRVIKLHDTHKESVCFVALSIHTNHVHCKGPRTDFTIIKALLFNG